MDHETVVRQNISERYLLAELEPELQDEFEEHFFNCPECARDVRAGSELVAHSKYILAENAAPVALRVGSQRSSRAQSGTRFGGWMANWFRPAFAVPALAILLLVVAYQNFVTLPRLTRDVNQAQILPAATINLLTYGANAAPLSVRAGEGFLLNVVVPPGKKYDNYRADLYDPAGRLRSSLPIAGSTHEGSVGENSVGDVWSIRFPAVSQSGTYKLAVYGVSNGGEAQVGSGAFELQIRE